MLDRRLNPSRVFSHRVQKNHALVDIPFLPPSSTIDIPVGEMKHESRRRRRGEGRARPDRDGRRRVREGDRWRMKYVGSGVRPVSTDNICSTRIKVEGGCAATRTALAIHIICGTQYQKSMARRAPPSPIRISHAHRVLPKRSADNGKKNLHSVLTFRLLKGVRGENE